MKKDVLVLVATGFEDMELITPLDLFARNNISYDLVSIENKNEVKGKYETIVKTKQITDIYQKNYRSLFLPGGPGTDLLIKDNKVLELTKYFGENKHLFAICAAPSIILKSGINIEDYTAYPGSADSDRNSGKQVVVSNNIITGRDYLSSKEFAYKVIEKIKSI